jgi:hypothetical protein
MKLAMHVEWQIREMHTEFGEFNKGDNLCTWASEIVEKGKGVSVYAMKA